jgi:thiol-disulfide isomerase/thioredoxin
MKKLFLAVIIGAISYPVWGQGVLFSQDSSWQEILQKAKDQKKYIFVDCYASWCGPCKWMDKEVYPNDTVGKFMNDNFVCVKIQMDSTTKDQKYIQHWYSMARDFEGKYSVQEYPSFLFFNEEGQIVRKDIGAQTVSTMLLLAKTAMNAQTSYYTQLSEYTHGNLKYSDLMELAGGAKMLGQDSLALQIAKDYMLHYLDFLPLEQVLSKRNIEFIGEYQKAISSGDKLFHLYFLYRKKVDSIMSKPRYADGVINNVIYKEEIVPMVHQALAKQEEPKWREVEKLIELKFAKEYVQYNILRGRVDFYRGNKEWRNYAKYVVIRCNYLGVLKFPNSYGTQLSDRAFEVFLYSNRKKELKTALLWANRAIEMEGTPDGETLDTKANILYKLGRQREGIALERQAVNLKPTDREISENFSKMQKGLPTWQM